MGDIMMSRPPTKFGPCQPINGREEEGQTYVKLKL